MVGIYLHCINRVHDGIRSLDHGSDWLEFRQDNTLVASTLEVTVYTDTAVHEKRLYALLQLARSRFVK